MVVKSLRCTSFLLALTVQAAMRLDNQENYIYSSPPPTIYLLFHTLQCSVHLHFTVNT